MYPFLKQELYYKRFWGKRINFLSTTLYEKKWPEELKFVEFIKYFCRPVTIIAIYLKHFIQNDNSTIATIEKQMGEVDDRIDRLTDQLRNMESDLDESYLQKIKGNVHYYKKLPYVLVTLPVRWLEN